MGDHKTTAKDFATFKKEAKYWVKRFGLLGWDILYQHEDVDDGSAAYLLYPADLSERLVTIGLSETLGDRQYGQEYIKKLAFHEVCELLLCRFVHIAADRYAQKKDILEESHNVIMTLENAVWSERGKIG